MGPGEKLVLITPWEDAVFGWRKAIRADGQTGVECSLFRNESPILSSELILEAERLAWQRWPGERLFTYVDPRKVASRNPGYCYLKAGWKRSPLRSGRGMMLLEKLPT